MLTSVSLKDEQVLFDYLSDETWNYGLQNICNHLGRMILVLGYQLEVSIKVQSELGTVEVKREESLVNAGKNITYPMVSGVCEPLVEQLEQAVQQLGREKAIFSLSRALLMVIKEIRPSATFGYRIGTVQVVVSPHCTVINAPVSPHIH